MLRHGCGCDCDCGCGCRSDFDIGGGFGVGSEEVRRTSLDAGDRLQNMEYPSTKSVRARDRDWHSDDWTCDSLLCGQSYSEIVLFDLCRLVST